MDDLDLGATLKGFSPGQKVFNRYTLQRLLGRGGMGVVWLARDEELEREVALKFLPEVVAMDAEAVRDLKRETRRSLELTHPHIIRIYDFVQDARTAAISMEYVAGDTLARRKLDQPHNCFQPADLERWIEQLAEALDYAHRRAQIVHRDLKPANLMIDDRGDLKIADFGIAASVSDSVSRVSAQAGSSGTPVYMSPQQMMGEKPAVTDDVYSFGALLFDLLTGKPPFHAGNVVAQVQSKVPPSITARRAELEVPSSPAVPAAWEETIAACLAKEPADRPQSAGEVLRRLRGEKAQPRPPAATPAPTAPAPVAPSPAPGPAPARSRGPLYAALAVLLVLLGGTGWYFGVHAPEQARLAEIRRLEAEGRAAEALRLKNEREREETIAREKAERLQREHAITVARIEALIDGSPPALFEQTRKAVHEYLDSAPEWFVDDIQQRWIARSAAWEAARAAAARGGIAVRTNPPGAEVAVGALALEKSPLSLPQVKLGTYPVRIRLDGYEEWTGEAVVKENEFTSLNVDLVRSTGRVAIRGTEGAVVSVDGKRRGAVPLSITSVPTGPVAYEVTLDRHRPMRLAGEVKRNEELVLAANLERILPRPDEAFENTLGMKFVPLGTGNLLMSVYETRVADYRAFVRATGHRTAQGANLYSLLNGNWAANQGGHNWENPGFSRNDQHPVSMVTGADAVAFCRWLTERDRASGDLRPDQSYWLQTPEEWMHACRRPDGTLPRYPWGDSWPPPADAGNLAGPEARTADWPNWDTIEGRNDRHPRTAPVGSFKSNHRGIHDLTGNVGEFVRLPSGEIKSHGFGFTVAQEARLTTVTQESHGNVGSISIGFRVVLDTGGAGRR